MLNDHMKAGAYQNFCVKAVLVRFSAGCTQPSPHDIKRYVVAQRLAVLTVLTMMVSRRSWKIGIAALRRNSVDHTFEVCVMSNQKISAFSRAGSRVLVNEVEKRMKIATAFLIAASTLPVCAQQFQIPPNLEKLASQAEETVDVTLDGSMLQLAGKFLSDSDEDQAKVKKLVSGLRGIYVRSYDFHREKVYSEADLESVRAQFPKPDWSTIIGVRSKDSGDNVDVFFKVDANGQLGGIAVIDAEPTSFTIVNIVGKMNPEQLGELGGQFGIPHLEATNWSAGRKRP